MNPPSDLATALCRLPSRTAAALLFAAVCVFLLQSVGIAELPLEPRASIQSAVVPLIENYCLDCHSEGAAEADLELDVLLAAESVHLNRRSWSHVIQRLRQGDMPPEEAEQPPAEQREAVASWLQEELDSLDCSQLSNPGKVTIRRLNRMEYANTIRDWLGIEFDATTSFPQDELGYGFDNIGDVLSMSPLLLEKYIDAAEQISARAIVTPESIREPEVNFARGRLRGGDQQDEDVRILATNGKVFATFPCVTPGQYLLRARVHASQAGDGWTKMKLSAGDETLNLVEVEADRTDPDTYVAAFEAQPGQIEVSAALVNDLWRPSATNPERRDRNLYIHSLTVVGPVVGMDSASQPEAHRRLLPNAPSLDQWRADSWRQFAEEALRQWTRQAFRRPPTDTEIQRLVAVVADARRRGDSYQRAMQLALQGVLTSPNFLFRGETNADDLDGVRNLSDYELATRLSYFLWRSTPDERLLKLADAGQLRQQLDAEVDRLIANEKSHRCIDDFGEQWLETRNLDGLERFAELYPEFDEELRNAMRSETIFFLRDMWRRNLPLQTLLTADYSFVNQRLASHYGMQPQPGSALQKATLPEHRQIGLLGHASVLAVTSYVDRTSPVIRGKWILQRLLNDPPPPPPPDVPELAEVSEDSSAASLRERLEQHRADPACAACHKRMDPLGFAMENFDAVGQWRDRDGKVPIDAAGELPDGRSFVGPTALRDVLLGDFDRVRRALAEHLLIYALGRGLEYYDQCAVDQIVKGTIAGGDTLSSMVRAIVSSPAFLQRNEGQ